jgi:hypothetical protein
MRCDDRVKHGGLKGAAQIPHTTYDENQQAFRIGSRLVNLRFAYGICLLDSHELQSIIVKISTKYILTLPSSHNSKTATMLRTSSTAK